MAEPKSFGKLVSNCLISKHIFFLENHVSHKKTSHLPLYWFFHRDPYGLVQSQHSWVGFHPQPIPSTTRGPFFSLLKCEVEGSNDYMVCVSAPSAMAMAFIISGSFNISEASFGSPPPENNKQHKEVYSHGHSDTCHFSNVYVYLQKVVVM